MAGTSSRTALAGTLAGMRFAVKSLEPSLMRRSAIDQGLITAGSFLTGFVAGSTVARVAGALPAPFTSGFARLLGAAATAAGTASVRTDRNDPAEPEHGPGAAWAETAADIVGSVAIASILTDEAPRGVKMLALAGAVAPNAVDAESALGSRDDSPDASYLATAAGVAAGANVVAGGLVLVVRLAAKAPSLVVSSRVAGALLSVPAGLAALGGIGAALGAAASSVAAKIEAGNAATERAYAEPPIAATASGSAYSIAPYDTLGLQGRRLVSSITSTEDIEQLMGEPAIASPVRVYVGMATATTDEERIEIAVQEMRRTGGFDRSTIIAASPAGTGYVNYITTEAAEYLARGDVATVAIQYGGLPSMMSIARVGHAAELYGKLLVRLRSEIDELGRGTRLVAYGESLGALTSQLGVGKASEGHDGLIVDAALWVGTPQGSRLFDELIASGVPVFDRYEQYEAHLDDGADPPPVTLLNHDNDPVTKFSPAVFYEMPAWMRRRDRGRGTNAAQRWLPGVAFWQALIDTKNAATVIPGEFYSTGHDYRADLARFVLAAYGFPAVSPEQLAAVEEQLRASEVERASAIELGKV